MIEKNLKQLSFVGAFTAIFTAITAFSKQVEQTLR